jgi:putative peptide zinc metalloprotease protein
VRAHTSGRLALPGAADLPGQYVSQGSLLGHVLTGEAPAVRVALPEAQAHDLRAAHPSVSVRLAASPTRALPGELLRDSVAALRQLPSAALSRRHGGDVATDPADGQDLTPLQPVVMLEVRLLPATAEGLGEPAPRLGERAWVRLDDGFSPLAWQGLRWVQRQVLQRFNPQF